MLEKYLGMADTLQERRTLMLLVGTPEEDSLKNVSGRHYEEHQPLCCHSLPV